MAPRTSSASAQHKSVFFPMDDAKASFSLFCSVCGMGSLTMPANYARAGPVYASIALAFMIFANTYATLKLSRVLLVSPSSVKTYGDLGEWALGKYRRHTPICESTVKKGSLLHGASQWVGVSCRPVRSLFWVAPCWTSCSQIRSARRSGSSLVILVCLIPTLKESAGMAFAASMGTVIADVIAVAVLQWNMRGHGSIPSPDVSVHQVLMCFGNLALAYGAAIVIPDLQRKHSQPQRMPRVVVITILFISAFFVAIALAGYTAGGCQLSGNILYSIVSTSDPLGLAPLGFTADRGAVVMAYLFMQVHITIAFSTLMMPPLYMAERLILGMHVGPKVVRCNGAEDRANAEQDLELQGSCVRSSTPNNMSGRQVSTSSLVEKTEGQMSQLRMALEFGDEITEQQLHEPYKGNATLHYSSYLYHRHSGGATAHTTSCLPIPLIIYLRVFWRKMSFLDKGASIIVIAVCAAAGCYVMIYAGKELFTPSDDDTLFSHCEAEFMDHPYYIRNSTN